jgi:uncharacterized protein YjbI with pentapeptide repeats
MSYASPYISNLIGASLNYTNLTGAILNNANPIGANLSWPTAPRFSRLHHRPVRSTHSGVE